MSLYRRKTDTFVFKKPLRPDMIDEMEDDEDDDDLMIDEFDPEAEKQDELENKELTDRSSAARKKLTRVMQKLTNEPSDKISGEYVDAVVKSMRDSFSPLTPEETMHVVILLLHVSRVSEAAKLIRELVEKRTITLDIATAVHAKATSMNLSSLAERMARLEEQLKNIQASKASKA